MSLCVCLSWPDRKMILQFITFHTKLMTCSLYERRLAVAMATCNVIEDSEAVYFPLVFMFVNYSAICLVHFGFVRLQLIIYSNNLLKVLSTRLHEKNAIYCVSYFETLKTCTASQLKENAYNKQLYYFSRNLYSRY
jgi:hypothetical protein